MSTLDGTFWTLAAVGDEPALGGVRTHVQIADGRIAGVVAINRFSGPVTFDGDLSGSEATVTFGPVVTTLMAGLPEAMQQEDAVLRAFDGTQPAHLDGEPGAEGTTLTLGTVVLAAADPETATPTDA